MIVYPIVSGKRDWKSFAGVLCNHIHLIARAKESNELSNILRDFKKYSCKALIRALQLSAESRKEWLLPMLRKHGEQNPKNTYYQVWRNDNHPIELITNAVMDQKMDYIHNNPVAAGIVDEPEAYVYSSARDYAGQKGLLEVSLL